MPRCLAQPYPLSLSFLPPHAVVRGSSPLGLVYDAAVSGTAVPALPPFYRHTLLCAGRSLSGFTIEVGRGWSVAAVSGTAVPAPSLVAA